MDFLAVAVEDLEDLRDSIKEKKFDLALRIAETLLKEGVEK